MTNFLIVYFVFIVLVVVVSELFVSNVKVQAKLNKLAGILIAGFFIALIIGLFIFGA